MRTVILNIMDNKKRKPLQVQSTNRGNDQLCGFASAGSGICHVRDLVDGALDRFVSAPDFKNSAQASPESENGRAPHYNQVRRGAKN